MIAVDVDQRKSRHNYEDQAKKRSERRHGFRLLGGWVLVLGAAMFGWIFSEDGPAFIECMYCKCQISSIKNQKSFDVVVDVEENRIDVIKPNKLFSNKPEVTHFGLSDDAQRNEAYTAIGKIINEYLPSETRQSFLACKNIPIQGGSLEI